MTTDMLRCALRGVAAYRPVVDEPVMRLALGVLDKLSAGDGSGAVEDYARLFYALRSAGSRSLGEWLDGRLRDRESPYAALAERGGEDPALEAAARRDIETFTLLAELDWDQVLAEVGGKAPREYGPVLANLPRWRGSSPFSFAELTEFYRANGAGLFARHRAFLWEDGALCPVEQPDCPGADEMLGYELQRNRVIANTRAMLEGNLVNRPHYLYGGSGTDDHRSEEPAHPARLRACRAIEVKEGHHSVCPDSSKYPGRGGGYEFILFIDDQRSGRQDPTPPQKTILGRPATAANVAVYATSTASGWYGESSLTGRGQEWTPVRPFGKPPVDLRFPTCTLTLPAGPGGVLGLVMEGMAEQAGLCLGARIVFVPGLGQVGDAPSPGPRRRRRGETVLSPA